MEMTLRMKASTEVARKAAAESIVLLKNEAHLLPLAAGTKVAVFGIGQIHTIKGGTGSGEVNNIRSVNILEGLASSTLLPDPKLSEVYTAWAAAHPPVKQGLFAGSKSTNFNEEVPIEGLDLAGMAAENDAAILVISRIAGEGEDLTASKGAIYLTDAEDAMVSAVCAAFDKVILLLNTAGYMEIASYLPLVSSVVFVGLPGQEGGHAIADVLTGAVPASGKLNDTWPLTYADYPNCEAYSKFVPSGNQTMGGFDDHPIEQTLVPYHDDIYVGYRYFDTFGKDVLYPFGYGMSYGNPVITDIRVGLEDKSVIVRAKVTNTCKKHAAKQVVQVYLSAPDGRLEKPYQELKGFAKTQVIEPGEVTEVRIVFPVTDLASYDTASASYILERGMYYIRVGSSSRDTKIVGAVHVLRDLCVRKVKNLMGDIPAGFDLLSKTGVSPVSYKNEIAEKETADKAAIILDSIDCAIAEYAGAYVSAAPRTGIRFEDVIAGRATSAELAASMELSDLCRFVCGQGMDYSSFDLSTIIDEAENKDDAFTSLVGAQETGSVTFVVPGEAGQSPDMRGKYGIPPITLCDGPAGVRITQDLPNGGHQYCTAFPTGSLLACSWNIDILTEFGTAVGVEMDEYGVDLWLAPGMNIHRNPLCGRNFEYYSEDPLLTGECAAAVTAGIQSQGGGVTIKHFAGNNQEFMRGNSNDIVSERALREIYLAGFQRCVEKADPKAVMTSYNDINGVPSADNYDLCTSLLRDEWGFTGLVMTDWGGGISTPAISMHAGNDMIQPGGKKIAENLLRAYETGDPVVSGGMAKKTVNPNRADLEKSTVHILDVIQRCKCAMERMRGSEA